MDKSAVGETQGATLNISKQVILRLGVILKDRFLARGRKYTGMSSIGFKPCRWGRKLDF